MAKQKQHAEVHSQEQDQDMAGLSQDNALLAGTGETTAVETLKRKTTGAKAPRSAAFTEGTTRFKRHADAEKRRRSASVIHRGISKRHIAVVCRNKGIRRVSAGVLGVSRLRQDKLISQIATGLFTAVSIQGLKTINHQIMKDIVDRINTSTLEINAADFEKFAISEGERQRVLMTEFKLGKLAREHFMICK
jgi:hypothetical protein